MFSVNYESLTNQLKIILVDKFYKQANNGKGIKFWFDLHSCVLIKFAKF